MAHKETTIIQTFLTVKLKMFSNGDLCSVVLTDALRIEGHTQRTRSDLSELVIVCQIFTFRGLMALISEWRYLLLQSLIRA